MKKVLTALAAGALAFGLAACSDKAEPAPGTSKEKTSDMTAEQVYEKAMEASKDMKSAEAKMNISQDIEVPGQDVQMTSDSEFDVQMVLEPLAMHQKGKTSMKMNDEEMAMDIDMYMTEDGTIYLYTPEADQWLKMEGMMEGLDQLTAQQPDPEEQLAQLQQYAKEMKFEQTDDDYVLKLDADGEKFNDLVKETMEEQLPPEMLEGMSEEERQSLENMNISDMAYEIHIDKKTYDLKAMNMKMTMTMEAEGEEMTIAMDMKSVYTNINGIENIEVPQDVIDSAVDIQQQ
ncbi:DUF6612 family protein [Edaphobacillus lindanitolerans]|uniref:Outer membrane lipoprotein-sorting protein n=1 Tax=Edaphobacillus lindanitolerans TaxID=550447 RepID=A0A1U7PSC5_9BACI|nr:DUF6612 family protein [Edaphobacillus lindanitolerans]SIT89045.1 hypothetical protein SAMN05428946_2360 [Edaphobacillus lindanitolerans]